MGGFSDTVLKGYDLGKALQEFVQHGRISGLEAEADRELTKKFGRSASSFWVPTQGLQTRTQLAGTASVGAELVPTTLGNYVDILRAQTQFTRMGVKIMAGLQGNLALPRLTSSGVCQWLAETAACTLSELEFDQVLFEPDCVAAGLEYSKLLFGQSTPNNINDVVVHDLGQIIGCEIDRVIAHGSGSDQPTGLQTLTGVNAVTISANGGAPTWDVLLALEEAVATSNGTSGPAGFITNPKVRRKLKGTQIFTDTGDAIWSVQRSVDGFETLAGYRAATTSQIASNLTTGTSTTICSPIFFSSDWSQAVLGLWGGLDLTVDSITKASQRVVVIWAHQFADFQVRQPACFSRCLELLTV